MEKEQGDKKKVSAKKQTKKDQPAEHMTMSQRQNRFGKGRQQNGSDGMGEQGNWSNR